MADLNETTTALADALMAVWRACEERSDTTVDGIRVGSNLPEELSLALGLAAKRLLEEDPSRVTLAEQAAAATRYGDWVIGDTVSAVLVAHRPGSWEAAAVRQLCYPIDLLP